MMQTKVVLVAAVAMLLSAGYGTTGSKSEDPSDESSRSADSVQGTYKPSSDWCEKSKDSSVASEAFGLTSNAIEVEGNFATYRYGTKGIFRPGQGEENECMIGVETSTIEISIRTVRFVFESDSAAAESFDGSPQWSRTVAFDGDADESDDDALRSWEA